jgi:hypothetical protein
MVRDVRRSRLEREPRNLKVPDSPHTSCKCTHESKPKSRTQKPYVDHPQAMARTFKQNFGPGEAASPNRRNQSTRSIWVDAIAFPVDRFEPFIRKVISPLGGWVT